MFEGNVYFVPFEVMFTLLTCLVMFFSFSACTRVVYWVMDKLLL